MLGASSAKTLFSISLMLVGWQSLSQGALNVELKNIEGKYVTLHQIKGEKLTVLDFWATWCKPCIKAIPELEKLSNEFEDKGVRFVGINNDSPRNISKVRPISKSLGMTYPVLLDTEQELFNEMLVVSLPTLIILRPDGEVVYTHEGYSRGDEVLIKSRIEELLADDE
ncbi:MAG: TlpA disulfide reductase family protein [Marinoscillum sp.]